MIDVPSRSRPICVRFRNRLFAVFLGLLCVAGFSGGTLVKAQQLDLERFPKKSSMVSGSSRGAGTDAKSVAVSTAPTVYSGKPLSATISKTLYLPPAMYGQWSIVGTLIESNARERFSPVVNDTWILQREGNQVTISNPANGASATVSVDKVEGDQATFHRIVPDGRNRLYQETPTITVKDDTLVGQCLNQISYVREGEIQKEYYGLYRLEATRISGPRVRFKPETEFEDPDIQIEEVHRR